MTVQLELGLEVIRSYKRLSYTIWHALAEFVDNSTQSYFNNRPDLDAAFEREGRKLEVDIVYDRERGLFRISDNAMGMSLAELTYGLRVGAPPAVDDGRSKYGMGMKTAACWIGDNWSVRTKKMGEPSEHRIDVDVEAVASGENLLPYSEVADRDPNDHYTIIEISNHHKEFRGRTLSKIRDFLGSMYRSDLRDGILELSWQGEALEWDESPEQFLKAPGGEAYQKEFEFEVDGKLVLGWVGILERGSRAKAGFSILHSQRVVKGWPDSWRPEEIFGQFQGSNDLVNQRIVGEIHLDEFAVSHTKDDILWLGTEEEELQRLLKEECADYVDVAKKRRKKGDDQRGPTQVEAQTALDEMRREVTSAEFVDKLALEEVPAPQLVEATFNPLRLAAQVESPVISEHIGSAAVNLFLHDLSPNDPYVAVDAVRENDLAVIVNASHPHVNEIVGSEGFLNYLRHCMYDGVAEWQARRHSAQLDPDTIKLLKDRLLGVSGEVEAHEEM
ncbi:MAG: hypothetical protein F4Z38_03510 [Chloroflexi bacterium]|nr:hypothetical protein [Chloroflexota bacterium]